MGFDKLYLTKNIIKNLYDHGGVEYVNTMIRKSDAIIYSDDLISKDAAKSYIESLEREKEINKILNNEE